VTSRKRYEAERHYYLLARRWSPGAFGILFDQILVFEHSSLRHAVDATLKLLEENVLLFDLVYEQKSHYDDIVDRGKQWLAKDSGVVFHFQDWALDINGLWDSDSSGFRILGSGTIYEVAKDVRDQWLHYRGRENNPNLAELEKLEEELRMIDGLTGTDADLHPYVVSHLRYLFKRFNLEFGHQAEGQG
jgi:hypothetical protein